MTQCHSPIMIMHPFSQPQMKAKVIGTSDQRTSMVATKKKPQQEFCFPFSFSLKLPTCPGPTFKQVALSWQPPLPGSRQLLIATQSLPSPVQPCWHTQICAPVPVWMHSACRKNKGKTFETVVPTPRGPVSERIWKNVLEAYICLECNGNEPTG